MVAPGGIELTGGTGPGIICIPIGGPDEIGGPEGIGPDKIDGGPSCPSAVGW